MANIKMEFINTYRKKGEIRISLRDKREKSIVGLFFLQKIMYNYLQ